MRKFIYGLAIFALVMIALSLLTREKPGPEPDSRAEEEYVAYKNSEYGPEFAYPEYWGGVTLLKGNQTCPEEDTYRTPDTLSIFDWEFSFPERKLPGSESFIRSGIRMYELDPKSPNDCGDYFLLKIAQGKVIPESLSSFWLSSVTLPSGLQGIYNPEASRLNTESRTQYTLFVPTGVVFYVVQPYMSFIPYFGSPELRELEQNFNGDMKKYLSEGATAGNIRKQRQEFQTLAESLRFSTE